MINNNMINEAYNIVEYSLPQKSVYVHVPRKIDSYAALEETPLGECTFVYHVEYDGIQWTRFVLPYGIETSYYKDGSNTSTFDMTRRSATVIDYNFKHGIRVPAPEFELLEFPKAQLVLAQALGLLGPDLKRLKPKKLKKLRLAQLDEQDTEPYTIYTNEPLLLDFILTADTSWFSRFYPEDQEPAEEAQPRVLSFSNLVQEMRISERALEKNLQELENGRKHFAPAGSPAAARLAAVQYRPISDLPESARLVIDPTQGRRNWFWRAKPTADSKDSYFSLPTSGGGQRLLSTVVVDGPWRQPDEGWYEYSEEGPTHEVIAIRFNNREEDCLNSRLNNTQPRCVTLVASSLDEFGPVVVYPRTMDIAPEKEDLHTPLHICFAQSWQESAGETMFADEYSPVGLQKRLAVLMGMVPPGADPWDLPTELPEDEDEAYELLYHNIGTMAYPCDPRKYIIYTDQPEAVEMLLTGTDLTGTGADMLRRVMPSAPLPEALPQKYAKALRRNVEKNFKPLSYDTKLVSYEIRPLEKAPISLYWRIVPDSHWRTDALQSATGEGILDVAMPMPLNSWTAQHNPLTWNELPLTVPKENQSNVTVLTGK